MQEYPAAVDIFERLLELKPDELGHYTNLGRCRPRALRSCCAPCFLDFPRSSLVMVEDFVEAERVYMHVVRNRPYDPTAYLNLGLCR